MEEKLKKERAKKQKEEEKKEMVHSHRPPLKGISPPSKRKEARIAFGLVSFARLEIPESVCRPKIRLLPAFSLKIRPLQTLRVEIPERTEPPRLSLRSAPLIRVPTLDTIEVEPLQALSPTFRVLKPPNIRTLLLESGRPRALLQVPSPRLFMGQRVVMKIPLLGFPQIGLSAQVRAPRLKSQPIVIPTPREMALSESPSVEAMPKVSFMAAKHFTEIETRSLEEKIEEPTMPEALVVEEEKISRIGIEAISLSGEEAAPLGLLDLCFEPEDEEHTIKGVLNVSPERPVVILAEKVEGEDYLEALKHILREIYRIKVGGLPRPVVGRKAEEAEAGRRIHVIDDGETEFLGCFGIANIEDFKTKADPKKFLERVSELFSQQFGFLIIHATRERLDYMQKILDPVKEQIPKWCSVKIKNLGPDEKVDLASSAWGFVEPPGVFGATFDKCFLECENLFWKRLERLVRTPKYSWVKESIEDEEGVPGYESALHYLTKVLIAKYLIEKEGLKAENIQTEEKLPSQEPGPIPIPDIFEKSRNLAIEVETFYGTGMIPWRKLSRTLEKYKISGYKLWIVLPNLQMSLYLRGIRSIAKELEERKEPIEFYTFNVESGDLFQLEEYTKLLERASGLGI